MRKKRITHGLPNKYPQHEIIIGPILINIKIPCSSLSAKFLNFK